MQLIGGRLGSWLFPKPCCGIQELMTTGKRYKKRRAGRFELGVSISQIETFFDLINSSPSALPFAAPES